MRVSQKYRSQPENRTLVRGMRAFELYTALLGIFAVLLPLCAQGTDLDQGLIAYYPFENSFADMSGEGNTGIPSGHVSFAAGRIGQAVKLYGISDSGYVRVPNSPSLWLSDQFTAAWFLRVDSSIGQTSADCSGRAVDEAPQCVMAKRGDRDGLWSNVYVYSSRGELKANLGVNASLPSEVGIEAIVPYGIGDWVHLAFVYDSGEIIEYVNGVEAARHTYPPTDFSTVNSEDLYIGIQKDDPTACLTWWYPLNGAIDELRIYNRALSPDEVAALASYAATCRIDVSAEPQIGGTVSGGGTYAQGAAVTVVAAPNAGYQFVNWTENAAEVSTHASYTFVATRDCTLVAHFEPSGSAWRRDIEPGDILYDPTFFARIAGHVGLYVGQGMVIEAQRRDGVQRTTIESWDQRKEARLLGLSLPLPSGLQVRALAIAFAEAQLGKPYDYMWVQKDPSPKAPSWYCSELVWAAYYSQGFNLEKSPDAGVVTPGEIDDSPLTFLKGRHVGPGTPGGGLEFRATCPVDLVVTDPGGLSIGVEDSTIPGAMYIASDFNGDSSMDVAVGLPDAKPGTYRVRVVPQPHAEPGSVFTLTVYDYTAEEETTLANRVPVSEIPLAPYTFTLTFRSGDVNGDNVIDALDARLCLQLVTGFLAGTPAQRAAADVDRDGDVDLDDARILAEYIIGIRPSLP